jgi:hypothetical protein
MHCRSALSRFSAIAGTPGLDERLCPVKRQLGPTPLAALRPTCPGIRRSGFTHAMSSSLEHERYFAALLAVRKRKSSVNGLSSAQTHLELITMKGNRSVSA